MICSVVEYFIVSFHTDKLGEGTHGVRGPFEDPEGALAVFDLLFIINQLQTVVVTEEKK